MASISDNPMSNSTRENANQLRVTKPSCILSTRTKVNPQKSQRSLSVSEKFYKLYRHPFGGRTSPYRERAEAWLRSLTKGSEDYPCRQCRSSRWVCDRKQLRCESCAERHACCPRTSSFKKLMIMQDLGITEAEYDQLAKLAPLKRKRPSVAARARPDLIEEEGREEQEIFDAEDEEEIDQLADDEDPVPPPAPRPLALTESASDLPVRSMRTLGSSRVSPYAVAAAANARSPSGSRMRGAALFATRSDVESVSLPAETFRADDRRLLKELAAIRLALIMAQEKLNALLPDYDIPEESLDTVEGSNRGTPGVVPGISIHRVDFGTSPMRDLDTANQPKAPFEGATQEFRLPETNIGVNQGIDGFGELPCAHVSEKLKVHTLLNLPDQVDGCAQTPAGTLPDEQPTVVESTVDDNKENS